MIVFVKKRMQLAVLIVSLFFPENMCACDTFCVEDIYLSVTEELKGEENIYIFFYVFQWFFSISNNTLVVPWLEPGTTYCVSAQIRVTTPLLHSGFSKECCIATLRGMCKLANYKEKMQVRKNHGDCISKFFMYPF